MGQRERGSKQPGGGCSCTPSPALGALRTAGEQLGLPHLHLGVQKPPRPPLCPSPRLGSARGHQCPAGTTPFPQNIIGANWAKVDQAKDAEPCRCVGVGMHHGEVRRGGCYTIPLSLTRRQLGAAFCSGFNFFFFFPSPVFVSRSDISADGQAMTAANGSRALSPVSLATAGRENRTCQMENVNYSGCGGERCCEQRRRAVAEGGGRHGGRELRNGGQGWGGGDARQRRPGKQHRDDNIRQQTQTVGWRIALFHGQFCQAEPILTANQLTDTPLLSPPPRSDCPALDESSWKNINQIN